MVHVLERAHVGEGARAGAADDDHRDAAALGVGDGGDGVRHAGARGDSAHARSPGDARVAVGGVAGRLLVPDVDDADAVVEAPVVDGLDVAAAEGEEVRCAVAQERLGDESTAVDLSHAALIPRGAERS